MTRFAAVDLGASSGRVMLGCIDGRRLDLVEAHRFPNRPVRVGGALHWDILALYQGVLDGLRTAGDVGGIGIDSWAVDYALLDAEGRLLGNPVHYRDERTAGVPAAVADVVPPGELYEVTGVQPLPIATLFQFAAARDTAAMRSAARALLIPDLIAYWLTGEQRTELTNASTTGLLDVRTRDWATSLARRLDLRTDLFAPLCTPGTPVGAMRREVGAGDAQVFAVGSHDTASAVAGVPARVDGFAYISCGTWSVIGVETHAPITTEAARADGFGNELGVDSTVRFVRNVMGLWLLQQAEATWRDNGIVVELDRLLAEAERVPGGRSVIDPDRPEFFAPGDVPARIAAECRRTGQPVPQTPAEITRCILDSLAEAYRTVIDAAERHSGRPVEVVHIVGGGARNALLCQLTADACRRPVLAGPVEAAAYGNVLVQARAAGAVTGDLRELRSLVPAAAAAYRPR